MERNCDSCIRGFDSIACKTCSDFSNYMGNCKKCKFEPDLTCIVKCRFEKKTKKAALKEIIVAMAQGAKKSIVVIFMIAALGILTGVFWASVQLSSFLIIESLLR